MIWLHDHILFVLVPICGLLFEIETGYCLKWSHLCQLLLQQTLSQFKTLHLIFIYTQTKLLYCNWRFRMDFFDDNYYNRISLCTSSVSVKHKQHKHINKYANGTVLTPAEIEQPAIGTTPLKPSEL